MTAPLLAFALAVLPAAPPLATSAPADAVAWIHLPHVAFTLTQAEASPLAPLVPLLIGPTEKLAAHRPAQLVAVARGRQPDQLSGWLALDAGPAAPDLLTLWRRALSSAGFVADPAVSADAPPVLRRGAHAVTLFAADGRIGASSDAERASFQAAKLPLAEDSRFRELHAAHPQAHAIARVDVKKLYGVLARSDDGARLAAVIDRLGLLPLTEVALTFAWPDPRRIETAATLALPGRRTGLVAALGEGSPPIGWQQLPEGLLSVTRVSVRPRELFDTVARLLNYFRPLAFGLFNGQLRAIEDRARVIFDEDVLGKPARDWIIYRLLIDGEPQTVLAAGVADGQAGRRLFAALLQTIPKLSPEIRLRRATHADSEVVILSVGESVAVAIVGDVIFVGGSEAALAEVLRRRQQLRPPTGEGEPVAVSALTNDAVESRWLLRSRRLEARTAAPTAILAAGLHRSAWQLRRIEEGYRVEIETHLAAPE